MIERRKPNKIRLRCRIMGHKWRHALNPVIFECERCNGRWEAK